GDVHDRRPPPLRAWSCGPLPAVLPGLPQAASRAAGPVDTALPRPINRFSMEIRGYPRTPGFRAPGGAHAATTDPSPCARGPARRADPGGGGGGPGPGRDPGLGGARGPPTHTGP